MNQAHLETTNGKHSVGKMGEVMRPSHPIFSHPMLDSQLGGAEDWVFVFECHPPQGVKT